MDAQLLSISINSIQTYAIVVINTQQMINHFVVDSLSPHQTVRKLGYRSGFSLSKSPIRKPSVARASGLWA